MGEPGQCPGQASRGRVEAGAGVETEGGRGLVQVICRPPARQSRPVEAGRGWGGMEDVPQTRHTGVEAGTGDQRLLSRVKTGKHLDWAEDSFTQLNYNNC